MSPRRKVICVCLQVPMRPLRLPECRLTSVPANFGYSIYHIFSKGHAEIFREFRHDFCKKIYMEYPRFAGMKVK